MLNRRLLWIPIALTLVMSACGFSQPRAKDTVSFYYPRKEVRYADSSGVLAPESRDMAGHINDLDYLIRMYLLGPLDDQLDYAFPKSTRLLSVESTADSITLTLSSSPESMPEIRFSLACACLAQTCMDLSSCTRVTIIRENQSLTLDAGSFILADTQRTADYPVEIEGENA